MTQGVRLEFAAENQVGFEDITGEVIIQEKGQKRLHRYELKIQEGNVYQEEWSENFPHNISSASIITLCEDHPLLQDKGTSTILKMSSNGRELLDSWHHEGILLTSLFLYGLVYAVEKTNGEYEILIVKDKETSKKGRSEKRLQPVTAKPTWTHPYLSVTKGDGIAVTSTHHTLDIYSYDGR